MRRNSNIVILYEQTLEGVEKIYSEFAGFHMSFDELQDLSGEARKNEDYNCLYFDESKKSDGQTCSFAP